MNILNMQIEQNEELICASICLDAECQFMTLSKCTAQPSRENPLINDKGLCFH